MADIYDRLSETLRSAWTEDGGKDAVLKIIRKFLLTSTEGRSLMMDVAQQIVGATPTGPVQQSLLVVMHPDGWIDFYGYKELSLHFYTHLPSYETVAARMESEAELDAAIPERLRALYWPHATDVHAGHIGSAQVRVAQPGGRLVTTWMRCENQWPVTCVSEEE